MRQRILYIVFSLSMIIFLTVGGHAKGTTTTASVMESKNQMHIIVAEAESEAHVEPIETEACTESIEEEPEEPEEIQEPVETAAEEDTYRQGLAAYITSVNQTVTEEGADEIVECIMQHAEKYQLDEKLIMAVAQTESTYYSDAVSCADYKGLMQTGDVLAEEAGYAPEDLFDPEVSIAVGTDYMDAQMENFDHDVVLALTAYNQGPGSVYAGEYSTDYASQTMEHVENIENYLQEEGYVE